MIAEWVLYNLAEGAKRAPSLQPLPPMPPEPSNMIYLVFLGLLVLAIQGAVALRMLAQLQAQQVRAMLYMGQVAEMLSAVIDLQIEQRGLVGTTTEELKAASKNLNDLYITMRYAKDTTK